MLSAAQIKQDTAHLEPCRDGRDGRTLGQRAMEAVLGARRWLLCKCVRVDQLRARWAIRDDAVAKRDASCFMVRPLRLSADEHGGPADHDAALAECITPL